MRFIIFILTFITFTATAQPSLLTQQEEQLLYMINNYRKQNNLPPLIHNIKLTKTARTHIYQLKNINPTKIQNFNMHSWFDCNYDDNKNCMWDRPKRLYGYNGNGYEIITYSSLGMTINKALTNFKESKLHNDIILSNNIWKDVNIKYIGIAINKHYCAIWFGDE